MTKTQDYVCFGIFRNITEGIKILELKISLNTHRGGISGDRTFYYVLCVMLGRACKALCRQEEDCSFWTYREGFNRDLNAKDCFLKEGTAGRSLAVVYNSTSIYKFVPKAPFSHHISSRFFASESEIEGTFAAFNIDLLQFEAK
jgi:hypothetical protein